MEDAPASLTRLGKGGSGGFPEGCQIPGPGVRLREWRERVSGLDGSCKVVLTYLANGLTDIFTDAKSVSSAYATADELNNMTAVCLAKASG